MLEQIGKEMLDHAGIQVTQGYYHRPSRERKAALILEGVVFPEGPALTWRIIIHAN